LRNKWINYKLLRFLMASNYCIFYQQCIVPKIKLQILEDEYFQSFARESCKCVVSIVFWVIVKYLS